MGTRISLGKGFTIGASGLRYGRTIPGIRRSWVSVGRSGVLLAGGHLRHWQPAPPPVPSGPAGQGHPRPVRDTPPMAELRRAITHLEQVQREGLDFLAAQPPGVVEAMGTTPEGRRALWLVECDTPRQLAESRAVLKDLEDQQRRGRRGRGRSKWDLGVGMWLMYGMVAVTVAYLFSGPH